MTGSDDGPLTTAARAAVAELDAGPHEPDGAYSAHSAVAVYSRLHARLVEALDGSAPGSAPEASHPAGSGG